MAEFARGRVCRGRLCQGPSLLGAEMSSIREINPNITAVIRYFLLPDPDTIRVGLFRDPVPDLLTFKSPGLVSDP